MKNLRIDPANKKGFHIVDTANGYERIFVPFSERKNLIKELEQIREI